MLYQIKWIYTKVFSSIAISGVKKKIHAHNWHSYDGNTQYRSGRGHFCWGRGRILPESGMPCSLSEHFFLLHCSSKLLHWSTISIHWQPQNKQSCQWKRNATWSCEKERYLLPTEFMGSTGDEKLICSTSVANKKKNCLGTCISLK